MTEGKPSRGLAVLAFGAAVLLATGCPSAKGGPAGGPGGMPPSLVTAAEVVTASMPVYIDAIGRCVAYEVVSVQPQVSGTIVGIHFKDGAELKKGDPLFTIDPRPYQAQLDQARGALAQERAQLELSRTEFERMETLLRTNAVARQEFDTKKSAVAVMEAQVQQGLATVAAAQLNVEYCSIVSPIDGRAGQRLVDLGNVVAPNMGATLLVIQRQDPIYADFTVSERDLASVRESLAAGKLKVRVRAPGPAGPEREAPVSFLDNVVQDATGTIKLRALIENKDRAFWPGQFVDVRLILRDLEGALVVPATAVQVGQLGNYVYVVKPDQTAELRPIEAGQRHGDRVVVAKGLTGGESVVVTGQLMLYPGAKVMVAK